MLLVFVSLSFFFFNDTATTEIYTLSLHDALPIFLRVNQNRGKRGRENQSDDHAQNAGPGEIRIGQNQRKRDRKSTRLNSSHGYISYAVFCLKKKKNPPPPSHPHPNPSAPPHPSAH